MYLFDAFSGRINRINKLTKEVISFNTDKVSADIGMLDTVLVMAASFAGHALGVMFNPKYNMLIKYVNQIDETDMHHLYCVLVAHFIYRYFEEPFFFLKSADPNEKGTYGLDKNSTIAKFENKLGFTTREYDAFEIMESLWNINLSGTTPNSLFGVNDVKMLDNPTVKSIIQYCHTRPDVTLSRKIYAALISSYNYIKQVYLPDR